QQRQVDRLGQPLLGALLGFRDGFEPVPGAGHHVLRGSGSRKPASGLVSHARSGIRSSGGPQPMDTGTAERRRGAVRREWSLSGFGAAPAPTSSSARSALPLTHSGSGPSSGSPVKNFAAMHPPRQES